MRIAVCDDQETCRRQVKGYIENIFGSLDVIVDLYSSGGEILKGADKFSYDIIFLDIEMPGMDGISKCPAVSHEASGGREVKRSAFLCEKTPDRQAFSVA